MAEWFLHPTIKLGYINIMKTPRGGPPLRGTPPLGGSTLILYRKFLSRSAKTAIFILPYIQEVITGKILGDGNLSKPSITGQSKFRVRQNGLDFVQFLWDIFNSIAC